MRYYWQAACECVVEVSGTRYLQLRTIGECVWPEHRPLKDNRAVLQAHNHDDNDGDDNDENDAERRCTDSLTPG